MLKDECMITVFSQLCTAIVNIQSSFYEYMCIVDNKAYYVLCVFNFLSSFYPSTYLFVCLR